MFQRSPYIFLLPLILVLLGSSAVPPAPLPAPRERITAPVGPPSFGLNAHLATRYPDPSSMHIPAQIVQDLGIEWVREDLHWHRVQPAPDVWDWTFTDAALRELLNRDIQVLGVLGPSVGWATASRDDVAHDVSFRPPDPDAFVQYARSVVNRYQRYIKHWEIWNEPDNPYFWQPDPDPEAYAELLIRTSQAIKAVDPEAKVLIGGFNPFDTTFIETVAAAGAWDSFDILAVHPYVDPFTPEEGNLTASLDKMHLMMYHYGDKPIWVTELGWSSGPVDRDVTGTTNQENQANYLIRSMLLLWMSGVERTFWYVLKDDAHSPYGLIEYGEGRTDMEPELYKPAYFAFRTLNNELADTRFVERRDLFDSERLLSFSESGGWERPVQPNGSLAISEKGVAVLRYDFSTAQNDYLALERTQPLRLPGRPYAIGSWVYGDGTDQEVRVWLRDAEGETLQYTLGIVGEPGWRFISTPINVPVGAGNRIAGSGDGWLDFPADLVGFVLDDAHDNYIGKGTVYLDNLTAIHGHEIYDVRLERGNAALDVLWSPPRAKIALKTSVGNATFVTRDGQTSNLLAERERLRFEVGPAPVFLWHRR